MKTNNYKLIVTVEGNKATSEISILNIYDAKTDSNWNNKQAADRGLPYFNVIARNTYCKDGSIARSSIDELKETLNWNLGGNDIKYMFRWGQSGKDTSIGYAYIAA